MSSFPTTPDDPRLDGWYHTIDLGNGLVSKGVYDHRPVADCYGIPESLAGLRVLDVGTADGFFAFEMERRGADKVVAMDLATVGDCDWLPRMRPNIGWAGHDASWPRRFRMAHAMRGSNVEYHFGSVYELSPYMFGTFDLVFCGSLLLHLQNPLKALTSIRSVTRSMAIIETTVDAEMEKRNPDAPVLSFGSPGNEDTPGRDNVYWVFTTAGLRRMLEYADFAVTESQPLFELSQYGPTGSAVVAHTSTPLGSPNAG